LSQNKTIRLRIGRFAAGEATTTSVHDLGLIFKAFGQGLGRAINVHGLLFHQLRGCIGGAVPQLKNVVSAMQ
jgi:hypothetical protein